MKKLSPFLAGMLTMAAVSSLGVSALAATGHMTITVDPINVQVNGEVFAPTDVNGNAVPVFAYNGTTYAPLRALAEAYGLEVGYDAESNMATVKDPDASTPAPDNTASAADYSNWSAEEEEAYQEFKEMWEINYGPYDSYTEAYCSESNKAALISLLTTYPDETVKEFCKKLYSEIFEEGHGGPVSFSCRNGDKLIPLWSDFYSSPTSGLYKYSGEYALEQLKD